MKLCSSMHLSVLAWAWSKDHTEARRAFTAIVKESVAAYNAFFKSKSGLVEARFTSGGGINAVSVDDMWPATKTPPKIPVAKLKLLDGYLKMASTSPTWEASEARKICEQLREKLIQSLPGYVLAPDTI